jgi:hypothetical protein
MCVKTTPTQWTYLVHNDLYNMLWRESRHVCDHHKRIIESQMSHEIGRDDHGGVQENMIGQGDFAKVVRVAFRFIDTDGPRLMPDTRALTLSRRSLAV